MEWVIRLKSFPAFVVVVGSLVVAGLLGALVPYRFGVGVMNATAAVVYLGWPFLVGIAAESRAGLGSTRARVVASICLAYVVIFHIIAGIVLLDGIHRLAKPTLAVFLVFWMLAVMATFYLPWFGARTLVVAEERRPVRFDQYLGTLFEFLILPIGVLFLQKRVRALFASNDAG